MLLDKKGDVMARIFFRYLCMPLVLFGALNYSLLNVFGVDAIAWLLEAEQASMVYIAIGLTSVALIVNNIMRARGSSD